MINIVILIKKTRLKKTLFLIFAGFILRLLPGCIDCDNEPMPFDFSGMDVTPLDNTGTWIKPREGDKMARNAVAFEIRLFPDDLYRADAPLQVNKAGFAQAFAMEECPVKFRANQKIENIDVTSVFSISETIGGGSSVVGSMVGLKNNSGLSSLYLSMNELLDQINPDLYFDDPQEDFMLFLKPEVENDSLQFIFNIQLSDGRVLTKTSEIIYLY
jgi:hypothetical protein